MQRALLLLLLCTDAHGQGSELSRSRPCSEGRSWVQLRFEGPLSNARQRAVLRDLAAGLPRIDVCAQGAVRPVSTVLIRQQGLRATIEVRDSITDKRLSRDLDLSPIAEDGHALALAIAADELLRASWAELALKQRQEKPARATPPPPEVDASVQDVLEQPARESPSHHRLGARAALEHYATGQLLVGADLSYGKLLGGWALHLWLGLRQGLTTETTLGSVQAQAWVGGVSVSRDLVRHTSFAAGPLVALQGGHARFSGRPTDSAQSEPLSGPLLAPRVGAFGELGSDAWNLRLEGGVGHPLASVRATAGGRDVTGVAGVELWCGLTTGVDF